MAFFYPLVVPERFELPVLRDERYYAFVDPSGGSQDSMTLAIAHAERGVVVSIWCVSGIRPFRPLL